MVSVHVALGIAVIAVCVAAARARLRRVPPRRAAALVSHALVLAQTVLIAQAAVGLLLLSDGRRAPDRLHYAYGAFALGAVLVALVLRAAEGPRRLLWFAGTTLLAGALAVRAFMTGSMRAALGPDPAARPRARDRRARSRSSSSSSRSSRCSRRSAGSLRIAFFLAIAFFLFLLWRERRGDFEAWSDRNRRLFYAAIILAVVDVGMLIGLGASGQDALAFFLVLAACAWVVVRTWRLEHRY